MKKIRRACWTGLLFIVLANPGSLRAEEGFISQRFGLGARSAILGSPAQAEGNVEFLAWNPAGIAAEGTDQLLLAHYFWLENLSIDQMGLIMAAPWPGKFGFGATLLSTPVFDSTGGADPVAGSGGEGSAWLSAGFRVWPGWQAGASVKLVGEKWLDQQSWSGALDAGAAYTTPVPGLDLQLSLANIGITPAGPADALPLELRGAVSYQGPRWGFMQCRGVASIRWGNFFWLSSLGGECELYRILTVRAGVHLDRNQALRFGAGLSADAGPVSLDYGALYIPELTWVHLICLRAAWGGKAEVKAVKKIAVAEKLEPPRSEAAPKLKLLPEARFPGQGALLNINLKKIPLTFNPRECSLTFQNAQGTLVKEFKMAVDPSKNAAPRELSSFSIPSDAARCVVTFKGAGGLSQSVTAPWMRVDAGPLLTARHQWLEADIPVFFEQTTNKIRQWSLALEETRTRKVLHVFSGIGHPAEAFAWRPVAKDFPMEISTGSIQGRLTLEDEQGFFWERQVPIQVMEMELAKTAAGESKVEINQILFDYNQADLRRDMFMKLRAAGLLIQCRPNARVVIQGHTDESGSAVYNEQLSKNRATAVQMFLMENFAIPAKTLTTLGFGARRPYSTARDEESLQKNRRVEIIIQWR
jgi:outer membrane protein OmpA-like peptidoglycan-associated protein